jgi:hypothetical protein
MVSVRLNDFGSRVFIGARSKPRARASVGVRLQPGTCTSPSWASETRKPLFCRKTDSFGARVRLDAHERGWAARRPYRTETARAGCRSYDTCLRPLATNGRGARSPTQVGLAGGGEGRREPRGGVCRPYGPRGSSAF